MAVGGEAGGSSPLAPSLDPLLVAARHVVSTHHNGRAIEIIELDVSVDEV